MAGRVLVFSASDAATAEGRCALGLNPSPNLKHCNRVVSIYWAPWSSRVLSVRLPGGDSIAERGIHSIAGARCKLNVSGGMEVSTPNE